MTPTTAPIYIVAVLAGAVLIALGLWWFESHPPRREFESVRRFEQARNVTSPRSLPR